MRSLRKRLTVVNKSDGSNEARVDASIERYVAKMEKRGWFFSTASAGLSSGHSFFQYEAYVTIYKPNLKSQRDLDLIAKWEHEGLLDEYYHAIKTGKIKKDGVRVMNALKTKGWKNKAYSTAQIKSGYIVKCGYSGSYQQSHLIKEF